MPHVGSYAVEPVRCKEQTVIERIVLACSVKVVLVGCENAVLVSHNGIGNGVEDVVALGVGYKCQGL